MSWVSTANTDPTAASTCAGEYHGASKVRAETAIKVSSSLTSSRRAGRSANVVAVGDVASALRHDLIVVPAKRRLQQWRDDIHPRLGGDYGPVVAYAGGLALACE